jgi:hypothetical protein
VSSSSSSIRGGQSKHTASRQGVSELLLKAIDGCAAR